MTRMRLIQSAVLGLGLLCIAWMLWQRTPENVPSVSALTQPAALARSLQGTEPDGQLRFFANLPAKDTVTSADLPNESLKRMFDYYLSTLGEADEAGVLRQIEQEIDKNLRGAHALAARQLLYKYVGYKKALAQLEQDLGRAGQTGEGGIEGIRKRFEGMRQLREKYFDPREQSDMFGFEEAYDQVALSQLEVTLNSQLSEDQKTQRLTALQANLPSQVKAELDAPRQVLMLQTRVDQLREQGASDDEIYRLRAQTINPQAAARLAELDREEADWKTRIAQYQASRQQILQSSNSAAHQQAALQQLQMRQFSDQERPRLTAYESQ